MYGDGADTARSALSTFFLAMTLYPGAMRRAQQEIDAAVGGGRLPAFEDKEFCSVCGGRDARELAVASWRAVGTSGCSTRRLRCSKLFIPKGAIVMTNTW